MFNESGYVKEKENQSRSRSEIFPNKEYVPNNDTLSERVSNFKKNNPEFCSEVIDSIGRMDINFEYIESVAIENGYDTVWDSIQSAIADAIEKKEIVVDLLLLEFCAKMCSKSRLVLLNNNLAEQLERSYINILPANIIKDIENKFSKNNFNIEDLVRCHQLVFFLKSYLATVQSGTELTIEQDYPDGYNGLVMYLSDSFERMLEGETIFDLNEENKDYPLFNNYLLREHAIDFVESISIYKQKNGARSEIDNSMDGVRGGMYQDESFFKYINSRESYLNRMKLGIKEGNCINCSVFKIAPNLFAKYANGTAVEIYRDLQVNDSFFIEKDILDKQGDKYDYVYDEIAMLNAKAMGVQANKLQALEAVRDLSEKIKGKGDYFYYDLSQLPKDIHPFVLSDILIKNQEVLNMAMPKNDPIPLSDQEIKEIYGENFNLKEFEIYKILSSLGFRKKVMRDFGIEVSELSIPNQRLFLMFLNKKSVEDIEDVTEFCHIYGEFGLVPFLSLDYSPILGDKIVYFGIENDQEIVEGVFEKYTEIVDSAHQIESTLVAEINSGKFSDIDTQEMRRHLMSRAKDVLVDFIDAFEMAKDAGIELSTKEIIEKLAKIKADNILLSSALRMMKGRGEQIRLSDIKKLQIDGGLRAEEVSNDDQQEMKRIYAENYTKYPRLSKKLLEGLEVALKSNDSEFTMLRYEDNLTGFYRFDPREDGSVYFASFNIDKEFHGSGLGEAVMLEKIDQVAKEKKIHAECAAYARIGANYIERGFYATEASSAEEVKTLIIERDEMNQNFETKRMTDGEIAESVVRSKMAGQEFFQSEDEKVKIFSAKDNNEFDFGKMIMDGFVLTRYFESAVGGESKWYVALEKA